MKTGQLYTGDEATLAALWVLFGCTVAADLAVSAISSLVCRLWAAAKLTGERMSSVLLLADRLVAGTYVELPVQPVQVTPVQVPANLAVEVTPVQVPAKVAVELAVEVTPVQVTPVSVELPRLAYLPDWQLVDTHTPQPCQIDRLLIREQGYRWWVDNCESVELLMQELLMDDCPHAKVAG